LKRGRISLGVKVSLSVGQRRRLAILKLRNMPSAFIL
jgi:hypothetical protein